MSEEVKQIRKRRAMTTEAARRVKISGHEAEKESGIRKWLTYFILLVSAVVMIGWLIGTISSFLNGELSLKFILKSLTSILISALIFSFYLYGGWLVNYC